MIAPLLMAAALAAAPAPAEAPARPPAAAAPKPAETSAGPGRPAGAVRPIASDKPVRLDADEVRFSFKTQQVIVVGKPLVTLVHDDAVLTCRRLTGENDAAGKLKVAVCEGDVRLVRASRLVTCERATYDREASRVVCTGDPVLRDPGGTEARGTTLTYDMAADEVRLEGAAQVTVPGDQVDAGGQALKEPGGRK